ncbi:FAD/NAD(P)-binding protein [Gluconacetobacter asukensis]|uniref:NAD(P)-binding protein n=1 Tax=Gluconacetobacter asukensis TaxID=1017181 RepID=A0A7W4IX36_9PROT|nr:FAD/NAD(P)-binding protein [Gluconacetobacter asukensis]MBB2170664.1 NAD(P)-binding protein [Gluconacetobacter asukensis]
MSEILPRIAIIGGGFSGAAIAWHLTNGAAELPPVTVFEPREALGQGVAYGARDPRHRINVPAARMSLTTAIPDDFHAWLRADGALEADPEALLPNGAAYPARSVFGRYVAARLAPRLASGRVVHRRARVAEVAPRPEGGWWIATDDGAREEADIVVIATSHPAPAPPTALAGLVGRGGLVVDPWAVGALGAIGLEDRVLIVGTGLSMADVVASLDAAGHRGEIVALSRRGQVSQADLSDVTDAWGDFSTDPAPTARGVLRRVRLALRDDPDRPWQTIFNAVRRQAGAIWAALPVVERRRLVRHVRPFWDTRRFRIAPQVERVLHRRIAEGTLHVLAGRIEAAARQGDGFAVTLRRRGGEPQVASFDTVVTTTGPDHAHILSSQPFLAELARRGLLRADPVGLGVETDREGHALSVAGEAEPSLFVAGPLSRGTFGELMGLPEVTANAERIAAIILRAADAEPAKSKPMSPSGQYFTGGFLA